MPKHFTYLASSNAPGNKLQREAQAFFQAKSNLLITDVDAFVKDLKTEIDVLNLEHPKCRPLKLSTYGTGATSIGIFLGETYTVGFHIYPIKNEFTAENAGDLSFLHEISEAIEKGDLEQANTLVGDWIDELEKKEKTNA